jgi:outer membrane immunogenic protein
MRKLVLVASAVALWGMTSIAAADGLPGRYGAAAVYGYSWSGVYFGSHLGYGWDNVDLTENLSATVGGVQPAPFPLRSSHNANGWLGGVHLGAMKQFGALVVGAEFNLDGSNINGSGSNCLGITTLVPVVASTCQTDVNWMLTALSRVGFAGDRWLVYGTAGWAVAGVNHRISLSAALPLVGTTAAVDFAQQDVADGLAVGAGVEWAIAKDILLGVQYLHVNLDSRGEGLLLGGVITHGQRDLDLNVVTARLSYKWGGDCCAAAPLK